MTQGIPRRRFIGIAAAAAGLELLPRTARAAAPGLVTWRGAALGAAATLQVHHHDPGAAARLIERAVGEARRLERIFSIYREDSAISGLNRAGLLVAPPKELVELLGASRRYAALTGGAFDPTVQPLWTLYAEHFSAPGADPAGPSRAALDTTLDKIGLAHALVSSDRIAFSRPGMALTLNGIAQGYVTDRIVGLLRAEGVASSLVDLGEARALGSRPDGAPWRAALGDPGPAEKAAGTVDLVDRAIATSAPSGFRFSEDGGCNHLFDPRTGACARRYESVSVVMPTAAEADALATGFSVMAPAEIEQALRSLGEGEVHLTFASGERRLVRA